MELIITDNDRKMLREFFNNLDGKVHILFFEQAINCPTCPTIKNLLEVVKNASGGKVELKSYNLVTDREVAQKYGVTMAPAIVLTDTSEEDKGVIFYGIPGGYEFTTFMEIISLIAQGKNTLSVSTQRFLENLDIPLNFLVFVTPSCPHCPRSASLALRMALASDKIRTEIIEAMEFQNLSIKYNVMGVPKTVINGKYEVEGALPEQHFLRLLQKVVESERKAQRNK